MNNQYKQLIGDGNHQQLIHYEQLGKEALLSVPTPEHYLPLLYTLGAAKQNEPYSFFNDKAVGGSLTMTSVKFS